jgi:hypothetical protein
MSSGIVVRTSDLRVKRLATDWINASGIRIPGRLVLDITVGNVPEPLPQIRPILHGPIITHRAANDVLVVDWPDRNATCSIVPGSDTAAIIISDDALRDARLVRAFLLSVCILLVRRAGFHAVHAAALVDPRSRGWLLIGESRSGKSTTTACLGRSGWKIATDDTSFLVRAGDHVEVLGWREHVALREGTLKLAAFEGGQDLESRGKRGWLPEELGSEWVSSVQPSIIAFPEVGNCERTALTSMPRREALTQMMHSAPWVMLEPDLADENLALMTDVLARAAVYRLTLGHDIFVNPDALLELTP